MARPTIDQIRGIADIAKTNRWNLKFLDAPAPLADLVGAGLENPLNLLCSTAEPPTQTINPDEVSIRGHKIFDPGDVEYNGTVTLTFYETGSNTVKSLFRQWRELIRTSKSGVQAPRLDVQARVVLEQLNRQDERVYRYEIVGAWPTEFTAGEMNDEGAPLEHEATLQYDYFIDEALV